jgi:hypothetical protein
MFMTPHPPIEHDDENLEKGNPEQDAYAFLRSIIEECVARGLFRGTPKEIDLIAQTMWAGVHGVISLQIAKANDNWIEWTPMKKRAAFMIDSLIEGMKK